MGRKCKAVGPVCCVTKCTYIKKHLHLLLREWQWLLNIHPAGCLRRSKPKIKEKEKQTLENKSLKTCDISKVLRRDLNFVVQKCYCVCCYYCFRKHQYVPICQKLQDEVLKCYAANPGRALNCSQEVKAFTTCVEHSRTVSIKHSFQTTQSNSYSNET